MCGRYDLIDSPQMMMLYFMLDMIAEPYSNADVRPTNMAPIIRVRDGQRLALPAHWGLIPSWSKDDRIAQHTVPARCGEIQDLSNLPHPFVR